MSEATQDTIGKLLTMDQGRDAIHIAVLPIVAFDYLKPGQHVGLIEGKATSANEKVGVVDPFLKEVVKPGERFWLFLYPNTITSLRHEWTHPVFDSERADSEKWLRDFAAEHRADYGEMVTGALSGEGAYFGTTSGPEEAERPEFWRHIERATGKKLSDDHIRETYFRCSC